MKIGAVIFATDYCIALTELAPALEERGFDSLFVPEHTHIPASRRSPWRGGGDLPREYSHTLDPFVSLAAAAAVTSTLRLGTGICLVTERDPIVTAKAVASLDLVSGGRFDFGIGAGWNAEEMEHHGTRFETRFRVMEDRVKAMQALWAADEASYEGEFTSFEPSWSWPKPVQKPHPPILLGGESVHTMRRIMDFCSGWFPRGPLLPRSRRWHGQAPRRRRRRRTRPGYRVNHGLRRQARGKLPRGLPGGRDGPRAADPAAGRARRGDASRRPLRHSYRPS